MNDGVCFLKSIIDHTYTNTLSNADIARGNLSSLDLYIEYLPKSDVTKMNEHIKENQKELEAAGQHTTDLIINLFKGYGKAKDKTFCQWIQRKKDDYMERN